MDRIFITTKDSPEVKQKLVCGLCGCPIYPNEKIIVCDGNVSHFACEQDSEASNNY